MAYKHILVAVDLTGECQNVIERAHELAGSMEASLHLVHVIEPMTMAFGGDMPVDLSTLQRQQMELARAQLEALVRQYPRLSAERCHLICGQPRQEVHRLARELQCDLIVSGSHGRHGLALLLGSTANDILHGAPCDLLAVHLGEPPAA